MSISRRRFLEGAALSGVAAGITRAAETGTMPMRTLGRTGARVSLLAFGCGSRWWMKYDEDKGIEALNRALDLGINYIDTAYAYGNGISETRIGKVLAARNRKSVFLQTKVPDRTADGAMRIVEGSLKRLQTDQLDLLHIHNLTTEDDLKQIEAKGGVLELVRKLRDQKVTRFIGITSHSDPAVLAKALDRHDFDCSQMALNAALVGMRNGAQSGDMDINPAMKTSFETVALPVAARKKVGVIAMKVFAQGGLEGQAAPEKLLYYAMSLPGVSIAVAGMPTLQMLEQNVAWAKSFKPLPKAEREQLSQRLSAKNKMALDRWFRDHIDA